MLFGQKRGCDVRLALAESIDGGHSVRVVLESNVSAYRNLFPVPRESVHEL